MWKFDEIGPRETRTQSKNSQFFESDQGSAGDAESLIRESIQNALDAKLPAANDKPVRVNISIGYFKRKSAESLFHELNRHIFAAKENDKKDYLEPVPNSVPYVLIEDFNTTGFDGSFDNNDEHNKGSLVKFWWEEGLSDKKKGSGGSHGVGKVTLSEASASRAFFAYSIREADGKEVLFGFCRLGIHSVGNTKYREYARFGHCTEQGALEPLTPDCNRDSADIMKAFKDASGVRRQEPGASILIPNIDEDVISIGLITEHVVLNFYLPIMKGLLEVKISDISSDRTYIFNKDTQCEYFCERLPTDSNMFQKYELARFLLDKGGYFNLSPEFSFTESDKKVVKDCFSEECWEEMEQAYSSFHPVKIRVSMPLHPIASEKARGFMDFVIQRKQEGVTRNSIREVFRGEVRIKSESKVGHSKADAILDIGSIKQNGETNELSEFMKYCEDPGHTNWNSAINRRNEPKRYSQVWQKSLVLNAIGDLVSLLEGEEKASVENFADDIFVVTERVGSTNDARGQELGQGDEDADSPPTIPTVPGVSRASQPMFTISRSADGVIIRPTKALKEFGLPDKGIEPVAIEFTYEMLGAPRSSWSKYSRMEINLSDSSVYKIVREGIEIQSIDRNKVYVTPGSNEFLLNVSGFDTNRQLYVDVKDKPLSMVVGGCNDDDS